MIDDIGEFWIMTGQVVRQDIEDLLNQLPENCLPGALELLRSYSSVKVQPASDAMVKKPTRGIAHGL